MTDPVEFTPQERDVLRSLARTMGNPAEVVMPGEELTRSTVLTGAQESAVRAVVTQEIAKLAGKALRRTQDLEFTRSPDRNLAMEVANEQMAQFWGEVLAEYGEEASEK